MPRKRLQLPTDSTPGAATRTRERAAQRRQRGAAQVEQESANAASATDTAQVPGAMHPVLHSINPAAAAAVAVKTIKLRMLENVVKTYTNLEQTLKQATELWHGVRATADAVNDAWKTAMTMIEEHEMTTLPTGAVGAINAALDNVMALHNSMIASIRQCYVLQKYCSGVVLLTAPEALALLRDPIFSQSELQELRNARDGVEDARFIYEDVKQAAMPINFKPEIMGQHVDRLREVINAARVAAASGGAPASQRLRARRTK